MDVEWLSVPEVAQVIRKSEDTVLRAVRRGRLRAYRFDDRSFSISASDLAEFIDSRRYASGGADDLAKAG